MPAQRRKPIDLEENELKSFEFQDETYFVKNRFKVGKFLKLVTKEPVDALEIVLMPDSFEKFLDLEITMSELEEFMDGLSTALSGKPLKN